MFDSKSFDIALFNSCRNTHFHGQPRYILRITIGLISTELMIQMGYVQIDFEFIAELVENMQKTDGINPT